MPPTTARNALMNINVVASSNMGDLSSLGESTLNTVGARLAHCDQLFRYTDLLEITATYRLDHKPGQPNHWFAFLSGDVQVGRTADDQKKWRLLGTRQCG